MSDYDIIAALRAHVGASSKTSGQVAAFHLAQARLLYERALEELRGLEHVLIAREREAAASSMPVQGGLPGVQSAK